MIRHVAPLGVILSVSIVHSVSAETHGYAVSWLAQAMNAQESDCPGGVNPPWNQQRLKDLADLGYTPKQIEEMVKEELSGSGRSPINRIIAMRGRINGEPVNPYTYPNTVADPKLNSVVAKYGYGFNLDGKGARSPHAFEDPETHEQGVNNELARALGCMREFRGSLTVAPLYWEWTWSQLKETQPAWVITIAGDDLSKDGDVSVAFDRALEHLKHNSDGSPRKDMTYRIDPDPRWHNVYRGTIKNGELRLIEPGSSGIRLMQDPLVAMEFRMSKIHMRLKPKADRTMEVMVGGFQPWSDLYYGFAGGGAGNEAASTGDMPGIYYLLKKFADADPDPVTGQNAAISATYYMQAVPAFVVTARITESGRQ